MKTITITLKKLIVSTLVYLFVGMLGIAQTPQKISYQAVVRDAADKIVASKPVAIRISILQGSTTGTVVYSETQTPTSNINGLVSIEIGSGTVVSGSIATINWGSGTYFLKTETDPAGGTSYSISGTNQILAVPYAMYADKAGNGFSGSYNDLTNLPTIPTQTSQLTNNSGFITAIHEVVDEFTAIASQTAFTLTQTPAANSKVKMYINGVRISNTAYSVTSSTLTYTPANNGAYALSVGDRVQFDYYY